MCVQIKAMQRDYWQQLREWEQSQATVSPDQEGTPYALVEDMLAQAELRRDDILGDLGCGDGRILIAAAKRGVRGIGIELDPVRAEVARQNVAAAGVSDLVTIEVGDALDFDMGRITVATTYLYPPLLAKLSHSLKGIRFVASPFHPVPGLPMYRIGSAWYYESGEQDAGFMAYDTVGSVRRHRSVAGAGPDTSG
jgi:predicted RNA methylase